MIKTKGSRTVTPYWAAGGNESWNSTTACKMFLPCTSSTVQEMVTGEYITNDVTNGYELQYDSTLGAIHSTMPVGATGYFPAPSMTPLEDEQYSLMMYAGYLSFVGGDPDNTTGGRFSMGAGGSFGNGRFSLANAHSLIADSTDTFTTANWDVVTYPVLQETAVIEAAVGAGGFFYKIGLYNPSTNVLSTTIRNGTTGAEIAAYSDSAAQDFGRITFNPALRFGGLKLVGAARFDFASLPSNYLTLAFYQAAEWKRGNRVILKQWDY